jgi:hypothetical protein
MLKRGQYSQNGSYFSFSATKLNDFILVNLNGDASEKRGRSLAGGSMKNKGLYSVLFSASYFVPAVLMAGLLTQTSPASAFVGGVSGGGGNVMVDGTPVHPTDTASVEAVVLGAKPALIKYLDTKNSVFKNGTLNAQQIAIFKPLFTSKKKISAVVRKVGVDVLTDRPCFDQMGQPFDGSTISRDVNTVCISANSIASKVEKNDLDPQSKALLLHEYSELVGVTEEQARRIQRQAIDDFRSSSNGTRVTAEFAAVVAKPSLASSMSAMNSSLKTIATQVSNAAQNAKSASLADQFVADATAAKSFVPDKILQLPAAQQDAKKTEYQQMMDGVIQQGKDLAAAFRKNDNAAANALLVQMSTAKQAGHAAFR